MNERKVEEIDGISYMFNISTEQKSDFINGYIHLLNNQESFRRLENPSLLIKRILYYHLFQKVGKYLVIKTSDIATNEEYKALFEIVDIEKLRNNRFSESIKLENDEVINLDLTILDDFVECENLIKPPLGNMRNVFESNTEQIMKLFKTLVFHVKASSSDESKFLFANEIENFISNFTTDKFGNAFVPSEISRINCNTSEVQIKYSIMPNGF